MAIMVVTEAIRLMMMMMMMMMTMMMMMAMMLASVMVTMMTVTNSSFACCVCCGRFSLLQGVVRPPGLPSAGFRRSGSAPGGSM